MTVGTLRIVAVCRECWSLKDKRQVLKGCKERVQNRFNVSIAEIDSQDMHQRTVLGVAAVGTDGQYVNEVLSKVVDFVRNAPGLELVDYEMEIS